MIFFCIFSFQKKLKIHNRLRRIKTEIVLANLNRLIIVVKKKHGETNNFELYSVESGLSFLTSIREVRKKKINPE